MPDSRTIARPYAKAVFKHALAAEKLENWSFYLHRLSMVVIDNDGQAFLDNPNASIRQRAELLLAVAENGTKHKESFLHHFVETVVENKRVPILPDIMAQFEIMRAEQEKTQVVDVHSYAMLTDAEKNRLITVLSQRLKRNVTLNVVLDKQLLGGAIIKAGDLVIDGSIRGALTKLRTRLAA